MASNSPQKRNNPFQRNSAPSPEPTLPKGRPKGALVSPPLNAPKNLPAPHSRNHSHSPLGGTTTPIDVATHTRSSSKDLVPHSRSSSKQVIPSSSTFAPSFIKTEELRRGSEVKGIEGENDFSGKRYVWLKDPQNAFVKGWIVEDLDDNQLLVQCDDGSASWFNSLQLPLLTSDSKDKSTPRAWTK